MRRISRAFFTGLAAVLPIAITVYILVWLGNFCEKTLGVLIRRVLEYGLPLVPYVPGMGVVAGLVLILLMGLLLQAWIVRRFFRWGERLLERMPLVRTVYGAARDLVGFFSGSKKKTLGQVVMVDMGDGPMRQLGFLTREDFSNFPEGMADEDCVAVYLPTSYDIGGVTVLVPRSAVHPIDMSFQDAMRFALTAGVSACETQEGNGEGGG